MAGVTDLAFEKAVNATGAAPGAYVFEKWLLEVGSSVWYLPEAPAAGSNLSNTPKYTVLSAYMLEGLDGAQEEIFDQERNAALPADAQTPKVPAAGVFGFAHTTSLVATTAANTGSRPWFYDIQRVSDNVILRGIHEHQLNNEANWETYVEALINAGGIIT